MRIRDPKFCFAVLTVVFALHTEIWSQSADEIIAATGITEGLFVHVGTTDGSREIAFARKDSRFLAYGVAQSEQICSSARQAIMAANIYGLASVEYQPSLSALPFPDNLVNLLVVDLDVLGGAKPSIEEIKRVIIPGRYGAAYVKSAGSWQKYTKAVPATMGEGHIGMGYRRGHACLPTLLTDHQMVFSGMQHRGRPRACTGQVPPDFASETVALLI